MTIHHEHPFADPEPDRNPVRRFRGRMGLPVTLWTSGSGSARVGWTLSSTLVADGDPAEVLGLLDEDSDLADALSVGEPVVVNLLPPRDQALADAFAGLAPAPGGRFRLGTWSDTAWGPVLDDSPGWLGVRLTDVETKAGWTLLVRGVVEHAEVGPIPAEGLLGYLHGRYRTWDA